MELGTPVPQPKWYQRKRLVGGLLASALGLGVVAMCVMSSYQPSVHFKMVHIDELPNGRAILEELRKANAEYKARRHDNITAPPMEAASMEPKEAWGSPRRRISEQYNVHCYSFTGGTCRFSPCHQSRQAECVHKWGQGYFCLCPSGHCAGANGVCRNGAYKQIAEGIEIKNVNWPQETMYFPRSWNLRSVRFDTNADGKRYDDKFDFYKLTGLVDTNGRSQVEVMITTTGQPDYVAVGLKNSVLVDTVVMLRLDRFWNDIQMASTIVCKQGDGKYQLGSYDGYISKNVYWWYISALSIVSVKTWNGAVSDPGPKGQWTFHPPLNDDSDIRNCG